MSFYNDGEITEDMVEFPSGAILVSRCTDIGKFQMVGSNVRRCTGKTTFSNLTQQYSE